jgi:hypothetical protein
MLNYFKDLLATLIKIESHLAKISACTNEAGRDNRPSISTRNWRD